MKRQSVGTKLYLSVLTIFLVFATLFIVFQHDRERRYKIDMLNLRLQDYNARMAEIIGSEGIPAEQEMDAYVKAHRVADIRVTMTDMKGRVLYDNRYKNYSKLENHLNRKEIRSALNKGSGFDIDRKSSTLGDDFFYSATAFPKQGYILRSALPYNNSLAKTLSADQHYIWFAVATMLILIVVLYRFTRSLGANITMLRTFANRADHNESLDTEDLVVFPSDELGEIAEKIVKLYKRLQHTKKEQDVLKRQLTQNIAHELKTPVASIQGYVETILDNPNIDNAMKMQFLQRCHAQALRLTSLLRDISTLNRLDDASDMLANFEPVDISQIVANVARETALQLEENAMTFSADMPETLMISGNQSLLYSVFRNLTDNAIAYAGHGKTITLTAKEETELWRFSFSDNGCGVGQEHLSRIFERFYRVDKGRSRKSGGTGLGLAIVKNAVLLHGGKITARNNTDGGLRFDFTLKK